MNTTLHAAISREVNSFWKVRRWIVLCFFLSGKLEESFHILYTCVAQKTDAKLLSLSIHNK